MAPKKDKGKSKIVHYGYICNLYISVNDELLQAIAEATKNVTDGESSENDIDGDDDGDGDEDD